MLDDYSAIADCRRLQTVSVVALIISILSLLISSTFAWLTWRQNQRVIKSKAPRVVATIGLAMSGVRVFMPIVGEHRVNNMQYAVALRLRNDGERATHVTSIICYVAAPGNWGKTMAGVWPDGPSIPHEISTGDATWETFLAEVERLYNHRRHGEEMQCDVGFRMNLSTGETRDVGPVRLIFPPEFEGGDLRRATAASEPVWIEALDNVHCPTCDARLIQRAGRFQGLDGPNGFPLQATSRTATARRCALLATSCRTGQLLPRTTTDGVTSRRQLERRSVRCPHLADADRRLQPRPAALLAGHPRLRSPSDLDTGGKLPRMIMRLTVDLLGRIREARQ